MGFIDRKKIERAKKEEDSVNFRPAKTTLYNERSRFINYTSEVILTTLEELYPKVVSLTSGFYIFLIFTLCN